MAMSMKQTITVGGAALLSLMTASTAMAAPTAADLTFRVSTAGVFTATVELDVAPAEACVVSLESRVAINAAAVGKVRLVANKEISGTSVQFRARRMPHSRRRAGSPPELNLQATISCPGEEEIISNAFARYLDCGYSTSSRAIPAIGWVSLLKQRIK